MTASFPIRSFLVGAFGTAALLASCSHGSSETPPPTKTLAAAPDPLAAFETVRSVLQDPRCQNCHPPGDRPLQGDDGHFHTMNIQRGPDGHGMPGAQCSTCHGKANAPNSYGAHQPPGVPTDWHLPRPELPLVFVGRSPSELCEQLKDPARNGNLTLAALVKHVSSDPLVLWGWNPGFGRRPVGVPHPQFVAAFQRWVDSGAPCPPAPTADATAPHGAR